MNIFKRFFAGRNDRLIANLQPIVNQINALEEGMKALSDADLKKQTENFRTRLKEGEKLDALLPEAFATVREAARRTLGTRHYDVQLMGGVILHRHMITEMKTGEGKTQVAALAAYLNALPGNGVHVVTVNDYLARRDAEWMGKIYAALGMTCLPITNDLSPTARKESYAADITYATNNELGFDYLRDNMALHASQMVQRSLNFAIVDEVDSILIDEARTPLVISGPTEDKTELYTRMNKIIPSFKKGQHYEIDEKMRSVTLTDAGMDEAEKLLKANGLLKKEDALYEMHNITLVHHVNQALRAHTLFQKDVDYLVHDNQVVIVDEFTGRMMPGRRFSEGLHQALEAKEGAEIKNENQTLASITFQNYFRMYNKLAGMTGTAETEKEEFQTIYGLDVAVVPTHVDVSRVDETDIIYRTPAEKMRAIIADVKDCHHRGQPVLVGTTSIEKSEELDKALKKEKIPHTVLNARHHEKEAEIIAQAGRLGAVTIATNMAGRGTDIKLGGNLEIMLEGVEDKKEIAQITQQFEDEKEAVIAAGGLRVVGTERHESRRIDNQLRGRSGRQGDVGSSVFYISLKDDLMRIFAGGLEGIMQRLDIPENESIQSRVVSRAIETAQRKIEGRNFDVRKNLLKFDDVLNEQRKVIYHQRREMMEAENIAEIVEDFRAEALEEAHAHCFPAGSFEDKWEVESFKEEMLRLFDLKPNVEKWVESGANIDEILEKAEDHQQKAWAEKNNRLGEGVMRELEKAVVMQVLDQQWKDHLQRLDALKQGIGLRGYGQKDPLNEYKNEAFAMFGMLLGQIRDNSVMLLSRLELGEGDMQKYEAKKEAELKNLSVDTQATNPYAGQDIPRNAPCPCGSGKKYKHCHGKL